MSSLLPAALALLGLGMFALSVWVQESGPPQPLPVWQEPVTQSRPEPAPEGEVLRVSTDLLP